MAFCGLVFATLASASFFALYYFDRVFGGGVILLLFAMLFEVLAFVARVVFGVVVAGAAVLGLSVTAAILSGVGGYLVRPHP